MGTSAPEVGAVEQQPAVVAAEGAVADATPEPLKATEAAVEKGFNEFADQKLDEAKAAVPAEEAAQAAAEPAVTDEVKYFKDANLQGVISNAPAVVKEVKVGWKSTEFWLTTAAVILTQLGTLRVPGKYGDTIQTTALVGAYALSRGLAKSG